MTKMKIKPLITLLITLPSLSLSFQSTSPPPSAPALNNQPWNKLNGDSLLSQRYHHPPIPTFQRTKCQGQNHNLHQPSSSSTQLSMCQLLGMNCAELTDFTFSFRGFARRGGATDVHSDGWGLCFYDGRGLRAFHDPDPAAESMLAEFLQNHPVKTLNMVSHIRYATRGEVLLENVHPFQREMWGISFCFAHNGDVTSFDRSRFASKNDDPNNIPKMNKTNNPIVKIPWIGQNIGVQDTGDRPYNPIGATDSEAMFCAILNALRARFDTLPSLPKLHSAIQSLCNEITELDSAYEGTTILNFLLGCGPHIQFAYSWPGSREGSSVWNGLHYLVREPPFHSAHLSDIDYSINFATRTTDDDRIAVIATAPLTDDEDWVEIKRGELLMFDDGLPHLAPEECYEAELKDHGLESDVMAVTPTLEIDVRRYKLRKEFYQGAAI